MRDSAGDPTIGQIVESEGKRIFEAKATGGQTGLMMASLMGKVNSLRRLLELGADPTIGEKDGYTPLHGAAFQGRAEAARALFKHASVPNEMHADGFYPVHRACWGKEGRHTDTVRVFLENGDFEKRTKTGESVLDVAKKAGNAKTIELVLAWGSAAEEL